MFYATRLAPKNHTPSYDPWDQIRAQYAWMKACLQTWGGVPSQVPTLGAYGCTTINLGINHQATDYLINTLYCRNNIIQYVLNFSNYILSL